MLSPAEAAKNTVEASKKRIRDECFRIERQRKPIAELERDAHPDFVVKAVRILTEMEKAARANGSRLHRRARMVSASFGRLIDAARPDYTKQSTGKIEHLLRRTLVAPDIWMRRGRSTRFANTAAAEARGPVCRQR
jgi:hypothetical protein